LLASCAPQSVTREMDTLLDLIRRFLAFELIQTSLFLPLIYKTSMEEAGCGAVFQKTYVPVLKIEGNFSRLRATLAHFVGHLPPQQNIIHFSSKISNFCRIFGRIQPPSTPSRKRSCRRWLTPILVSA
ncbi:MAG: hypothetical protein ACJ8AG_26405, partial [Ktedonobacteraceae bacterium]